MTRSLVILASLFTMVLISAADQTRSLERHYQVTSSQRVEFKGISGSEIEFKSWDKNEVFITIDVRISASDERYETEYIKALDIGETRSEKEFVIESKELTKGISGSGFWSLFGGRTFLRKEIRGVVYVPRSNPLTTDFSYGSVTLDDIKGEVSVYGKSNKVSLKSCAALQRVDNDYGTTSIENAGGNLNLSGTSSTITIESFSGTLSLEANYSTIRLKNIDKSATVQCQSGKLTAEDIKGDLKVRADYSTILAFGVNGVFNVESKSGTIRAQNLKGLVIDAPYASVEVTGVSGTTGQQISISGQSSPITLESVTGDVHVESPYSNISLKGIRGSVNIATQSGRVTADDVIGDWISKTEYTSVTLRRLSSKAVTITNKSAGVDLRLSAIPNDVTIRNEYGSVSVSLPKGFSGEISLDAEYGSIETDFPIRVKNKESSGYAVGRIGTGSGSISIETKSGNIELTGQ